jgi:ABC-2 type transport system permease protein
MFFRIAILVRKELQALLRDRQGRMLLIVPVVLQLLVFPLASTLEVKNNVLGVMNEDGGAHAFELLQRFSQAQAFTRLLPISGEAALRHAIDSQEALLVVRFPPDFSRAVEAGQPASILVMLDGRRSNSGQIALGYVRRMIETWQHERAAAAGQPPSPDLIVRHRYNPNLDYVRHIVPSLVAIITTISCLIVTSLSVAREREYGTFDQLLVSPLTPSMIMIGKAIPALMVAIAHATIIVAGGVFLYGIPFQGNLLLLYLFMFFYVLALSGFGLLISSVCSTQQQAFLGVFSFIMPAILLSGFPSPVENMPVWLQYLDWFNPLQHFIVIVKGVFVKDSSAALLWPRALPLLVISAITLTLADLGFRRRIG